MHIPYFIYSSLLLLICIGQTLSSGVTLTHFLPRKSNDLYQWESLWCQSGQRLILHRDSHMVISCSHPFRSPFSNTLKHAPNCKPMQVPFSFSIAFFCNICVDGSHIFQIQQTLPPCFLFLTFLLPTHQHPSSCSEKFIFFLCLFGFSYFHCCLGTPACNFTSLFLRLPCWIKHWLPPLPSRILKYWIGPLRRKAIGQDCRLWYWNRAGSNIYRRLWKLQGWLVAKNDDIHPLFFLMMSSYDSVWSISQNNFFFFFYPSSL